MSKTLNVSSLASGTPLLWINPDRSPAALPDPITAQRVISNADTEAAAQRFMRFRPAMRRLFPELESTGGIIESELVKAPTMQKALGVDDRFGRLFIKGDHALPVAGSIKARGGIHEVMEFAESLALRHGLLADGDYAALAGADAKKLFADHQVAVGSTGNLGLSIGVMASALGFKAVVHMSADAKEWKKERLRNRGVHVVEHRGDYEEAVAAGRNEAAGDPNCHFVDDESSLSLYLGYSAAAGFVQQQLFELGIRVEASHPLFVYLPCGVGGAPGGITFGLAHLFGSNVHCFFAEPTQSPCFLVEMMSPVASNLSVYDVGLTNRTEADGLAVPRASKLAAKSMRPALSGVFTVEDKTLFEHLALAATTENLRIEPSAAAGFSGPGWLCNTDVGRQYLADHGLIAHMPQATHIVWTTGGLFVPDEAYQSFLQRGAA